MLILTLVPTLTLLAAGGWVVSRSMAVAGVVGPWEEVAASGRQVIELARPGADPALAEALEAHRSELSASLTQARRWAYVGERFLAILPWLMVGVGLALVALAAVASRSLARQLARPIAQLVVAADRMGRGEPLPPAPTTPLREVRALDRALRDASSRLAAARERAVATERTRVWGEMARRVAHEMKNPLTPLRLAAHRLTRSEHSTGGAAEATEVIAEEVARLEELAARFSELGRPPEGAATEVDLPDLLRSLLETDVPAGVIVELAAPPGIPPVLGRYDALFRAFRNLVRNAVEAMADESRPRLRITVRHFPGEPGAPGWVEARIIDNGPGLPAGLSDRIFEPDVTTKARGTGLGLPLVRQAVEADGGTVAATGRPGATEFVVRLPSMVRESQPDPQGNQHETSAR